MIKSLSCTVKPVQLKGKRGPLSPIDTTLNATLVCWASLVCNGRMHGGTFTTPFFF